MKRHIHVLLVTLILLSGCLGNLRTETPDETDTNASGNNNYSYPSLRDIGAQSLRSYKLLVDSRANIVELQFYYVDDRLPPQMAMDAMVTNLEMITSDKKITVPEPISIDVDNNLPTYRWTSEDIFTLVEENIRDEPENKFIFPIFILNGFRNGTLASGEYFLESILIWPDSFTRQNDMYRFVLVHEMGHAIGLVNLGIPMVVDRLPSKEDDPCQCHSFQEDSPMYPQLRIGNFPFEMIFRNGQYLPYIYNDDDLKDIESFIDYYS